MPNLGSYLQLMAVGNFSAKKQIKDRYSVTNKSYSFTDGECVISISDMFHAFIPQEIISDQPIEKLGVFMGINKKNVINFPLKFCNKLVNNKDDRLGDKYRYKIPWRQLDFDYINLEIIKSPMSSSFELA